MFRLRLIDRVRFFMERQFVKGALFQLLVVAAVIGLISLVGGLLVRPVYEPTATFAEAVWWAFLRLTDPGYLGDDEGTWRRIVSTLLTVSGYVVFLGALVAIMTQRLIAFMRELERGLTPVAMKDHVVILGWTNRTVPLVRELMGNQQPAPVISLKRRGSRLDVVILTEEASALRVRELRETPGIEGRVRNVILRSGSALQPEALQRTACLDAAVVVIPSSGHGPNSLVTSDVETIKALMSLDAQARQEGEQPPYVVAEVQDVRKLPLLRRVYSGRLEVVAGDMTISSLIAQNVLHPGLSEVYSELLTSHLGNEFYLRGAAPLAGESFASAAARCPKAIICGVLRREGDSWRPVLNAPSNLVLEASDQLVIMAACLEDSEFGSGETLDRVERPATPALPVTNVCGKRLLILGWNHRIPALIHELASYGGGLFEVDLVSIVPAQERAQAIAHYTAQHQRVPCQHIEADYMLEGKLGEIDPASYDTIILVSSDRLLSGEEADARAIVGHTILDEMLQKVQRYPQILLELSDPDNEPLIRRSHSETIISPLILSHLLGQVALRPELRLVIGELFTVGGAEILFRRPAEYKISQPLSFGALEALVAQQGETVMGVYLTDGDAEGRHLILNPSRDATLSLQPHDQIVVMTTSATQADS